MTRPLTRLRLVLPVVGGPGSSLRAPPACEAFADRLADALAVHGVQVRQQLLGAAPDGAPRADVALWLPEGTGQLPAPDPRTAPARSHVGLVVDAATPPRVLGRYDALLVPHGTEAESTTLLAAAREASRRAPRVPAVLPLRLSATPHATRDVEKAERGVGGRVVVVLDLRDVMDEIERVIVQLALASSTCALVLVAPVDDKAQRRVRELCERHGVDAWLAIGVEGMASSIPAADLVIARPSWDEALLCAMSRVAVALMPGAQAPLVGSLRDARVVDELPGVLQLAAFVDRKVVDRGALQARGLGVGEALLGPDRALYDALARVEPLPSSGGSIARWEAIGPHKDKASRPNVVVDPPSAPVAPDKGAPSSAAAGAPTVAVAGNPAHEPTQAQKIEDALAALKQKIAQGAR